MDVITILITVILVLAIVMTIGTIFISKRRKIIKDDIDDSFYGQLHRNSKMNFDLMMVERI